MKCLIFFLLTFYYFLNAQSDTIETPKLAQKTSIIKINEILFEDDIIKLRRFSWPFIGYEKDMGNDLSMIFTLKYAYYNYKNDRYFPTYNYYKYYGLINHKVNLDGGIRWYMIKDGFKTFGKGLYVDGLLSLGYYRSTSDISNAKFTFLIPALGVGLGYQGMLHKNISYEIGALFRKGLKRTYLNGSFYPQPNINYNHLALKASVGYVF